MVTKNKRKKNKKGMGDLFGTKSTGVGGRDSSARNKIGPVGLFISVNKIKLQRGYGYVSSFAIPFLTATSLASLIPTAWQHIFTWWVLFIISMIGVWIIGHLDFHKLWKNELELNLTKNPEWLRTMEESEERLRKENEQLRKKLSQKKA